MPDKPKKHPIADQFSDEEMEQIQRYGHALGGKPTPFDEEVESYLTGREANAKKMHAAQTGGDTGVGPSQMDQAAVKQRGALQQQAATAGQAAAAQAQGQQAPVNAPPAPSGPQGETVPYTAQKGAVGGSAASSPASAQPPAAPPPAPGPDEGEEEEGPPQ